MATPTLRSTYALDLETARTLEVVARRWGVSKSEALRRAIKAVAKTAGRGADTEALQALDELQQRLGLTAKRAAAWQRDARRERRASSARAEARRR